MLVIFDALARNFIRANDAINVLLSQSKTYIVVYLANPE